MYSQQENLSPSVVLGDFIPVKPSAPIPQEITCQLLALAMAKAKCIKSGINSDKEVNIIVNQMKAKISQYGVSSKYIKQRYSILAPSNLAGEITQPITEKGNFVESKIEDPIFFDLAKKHSNPEGAHLGERMVLYDKAASRCIAEMYKEVQGPPPDDIIHVTCSGYLSPSPIEKLVSQREWYNTTVTHSYHMGCYGSLPAIRMAQGFMLSSLFGLTQPKSRIDIVHTEILSAHCNVLNDSTEQIITMTLFSDGFIKYSAFTEKEAKERQLKGLKVLALKEHLLPASLDEMTWNLGPHNFDMTLSLKVPYSIRDIAKPFVVSLLKQVDKDFDREKENLAYAIHPGGPLIMKKICEELGLDEKHVELSNKVFYENGNLSSATIPYIFNEIINSDDIPVGAIIISLAFGPGLTISGLILEKV